ncbi:MAG: STAS domain-containing protein, partial [Clostridia bacterium]|nr:STAS domain-containing protein [Clostridia bacterium]
MQEVVLKRNQPVLEFALSGEIDSENADEFYGEVMKEYAAAPNDVLFDCAALEFIDSTTLGTFVKILKHVKTDGRKLRLSALNPRLKKLFVICALDTIME